MKLMTALDYINRDAQFQGLSFQDTLTDIGRWGRILYAEPLVQAYHVYTDHMAQKSQKETA